jgi:hypothetical protein
LAGLSCVFLDRDSLYLVERSLVLPPVIKLGCPRRFMVGDLLRHFQFAAVLQIRSDAGRTEGMIANPRLDAGGFDIIVQTLVETMMTGNVVFLCRLFRVNAPNGGVDPNSSANRGIDDSFAKGPTVFHTEIFSISSRVSWSSVLS